MSPGTIRPRSSTKTPCKFSENCYSRFLDLSRGALYLYLFLVHRSLIRPAELMCAPTYGAAASFLAFTNSWMLPPTTALSLLLPPLQNLILIHDCMVFVLPTACSMTWQHRYQTTLYSNLIGDDIIGVCLVFKPGGLEMEPFSSIRMGYHG